MAEIPTQHSLERNQSATIRLSVRPVTTVKRKTISKQTVTNAKGKMEL
jgi:hypothetical protein